ncbi:hypothetical protein FT641_19760 [Bacillus paranthracis]|uniref:hypothetical protein n=1 Tax=Bacillus paranthracis TaxID=2026186 RepID=UPI00187942DA|nr:hypothetical protein [Bacillus paranthracis]MBE7114702.1 hypothetical protein [Bacillus paranthracis]MBE7154931.1 hypothetical protein [Bacillus paranthracis]
MGTVKQVTMKMEDIAPTILAMCHVHNIKNIEELRSYFLDSCNSDIKFTTNEDNIKIEEYKSGKRRG